MEESSLRQVRMESIICSMDKNSMFFAWLETAPSKSINRRRQTRLAITSLLSFPQTPSPNYIPFLPFPSLFPSSPSRPQTTNPHPPLSQNNSPVHTLGPGSHRAKVDRAALIAHHERIAIISTDQLPVWRARHASGPHDAVVRGAAFGAGGHVAEVDLRGAPAGVADAETEVRAVVAADGARGALAVGAVAVGAGDGLRGGGGG